MSKEFTEKVLEQLLGVTATQEALDTPEEERTYTQRQLIDRVNNLTSKLK